MLAIQTEGHLLAGRVDVHLEELAFVTRPRPVGPHVGPAPPGDGPRLAASRGRMDGDIQGIAAPPQDIAVVRLRALEPAQVDVAAVGLVPRVAGKELAVFAVEARLPDTCLAEVAVGRPHEVAGDIREILDGLPVVEEALG